MSYFDAAHLSFSVNATFAQPLSRLQLAAGRALLFTALRTLGKFGVSLTLFVAHTDGEPADSVAKMLPEVLRDAGEQNARERGVL
jgi:hypothetical protein